MFMVSLSRAAPRAGKNEEDESARTRELRNVSTGGFQRHNYSLPPSWHHHHHNHTLNLTQQQQQQQQQQLPDLFHRSLLEQRQLFNFFNWSRNHSHNFNWSHNHSHHHHHQDNDSTVSVLAYLGRKLYESLYFSRNHTHHHHNVSFGWGDWNGSFPYPWINTTSEQGLRGMV